MRQIEHSPLPEINNDNCIPDIPKSLQLTRYGLSKFIGQYGRSVTANSKSIISAKTNIIVSSKAVAHIELSRRINSYWRQP